jgi:hypothetical protein
VTVHNGYKKKSDSEGELSPRCHGYEIWLDIHDKKSEMYKVHVPTFVDGTPLEWCFWREEFDSLFRKMGVDEEHHRRYQIFVGLFTGRCADVFKSEWDRLLKENSGRSEKNKYTDGQVLLASTLSLVAKTVFVDWQTAYHMHWDYIRKDIFVGNQRPDKFVENLQRMDRLLMYFPVKDPLSPIELISEQELNEVFQAGCKLCWRQTLLEKNCSHEFVTLDETRDCYYKLLYQAE